jgi:hypothetical protein
MNFILIDYENIQPDAEALQRLEKGDLKILIFAKAKDKLTFDRAVVLQPLGKRVEYVRTHATGSNALDFHIAFQLGVLACENPGATAYVISKDTGYDSLIASLKAAKKLNAKRVESLAKIPCPGPGKKTPQPLPDSSDEMTDLPCPELEKESAQPSPGPLKENMEKVVENLKKRGEACPRTVSTLTSTVRTIFNGNLSDVHISYLLAAMRRKKLIAADADGNVTYFLETQSDVPDVPDVPDCPD